MNIEKQMSKRFTIRKKLILYIYSIVVPILLIAGIVLFFFNYHDYKINRENQAFQSVDSLSGGLGVLQSGMAEIINFIAIDSQIESIMNARDVEILNEDKRLWFHNAPMRTLEDMIALKGSIKSIAIYPENKVQPYLRCVDGSSFVLDISDIQGLNLYQRAVDAKGKMIYERIDKTDKSLYETNRYDKIIVYREMFDLSKKTKRAFSVVGASASDFDDTTEAALRNNSEGIIVLSREGNELSRAGNVTESMVTYLKREIDSGTISTYNHLVRTDGAYDYYITKNAETGIIVAKCLETPSVWDLIKELANLPITLLFGVSVGLFPILFVVGNIITKPLGKMEKAMERFKEGDFSQHLEVTTNDEVASLAESFNQMVKDIERLIDENYVMQIRERESELTALQAQINPHFLYNTLDTLYWQAEMAGNEEIAENILELSQLFRMVLGQGKGDATVLTEVELVRHYLAIQKMRFSKNLDYVIDIDEEMNDYTVPKLILQPFVENSIVHGFENKGKDYTLRVVGRMEGAYLLFRIIDTGIGMTREQMDKMFTVQEEKGNGNRVGRYAVRNVRERLKIRYRDDFELKVQSEYEKGTTVTIRVPAKR